MLTIAYITNRRQPFIEWFWASLQRETGGDFSQIFCAVIDFYQPEKTRHSKLFSFNPCDIGTHAHVPPKPNVWNGPHRLTTRDYFAAASARNTAICLAPAGHIAFVDDLSVLMPGWLGRVRAAMAAGDSRIVAGSYQKVRQLQVDSNGTVVNYEVFDGGIDTRRRQAGDEPVRLGGGALFGCSFVAPVDALLAVNGFDEDNDSMGSEDYCLGLMLERNGYPVYYDRQMLTLESEEHHHAEPPFKRIIKKTPLHPIDASHAMLKMVTADGRHTAPNYFGPGGLGDLRQRVLAGEPFPVQRIPEHDWRDGQSLREM